mmetsp:Transcript_116/g.265  ORF Transcript_116/g.265 Transcript_116/m.265 type:complete len:107 (-) Transcript_116:204-524(-)|eukprot:CAMPEP_0113964990 /NCGR_PEP_ID=MMETSP0011_2-20120614/7489_1 /TAXON_ID=101924 /ORGANISM="Rhodosorus marinus" /LENGTH=106 /DNA_ID=CAMNT_0000977439 /DNA_START=675 /DNA_END=995 /DNA_ORIENTATION=- /assembly_acc=CAM_ASM_000156
MSLIARSERARQALCLQQRLNEETKLMESFETEDCPTLDSADGANSVAIPSSSMGFGEALLALNRNEYVRGLILELLSESELLEWKEFQRKLGHNGVGNGSGAGQA